MPALRIARALGAWSVAFGAGYAAVHAPVLGASLGVLGAAFACLALSRTALLAGLLALGAAAALPAIALARDPFHAHAAFAGWQVAAVALAFLGSGAGAWAALRLELERKPVSPPPRSEGGQDGGSTSSWPPHPSLPRLRWGKGSARLQRLLGLELGALAAALPISIAGTQIALGALAATVVWALLTGARPRLSTALDAPVACLIAAALIATALSPTRTPPWEVTGLRALAAFFAIAWGLELAPHGDRALLRLLALWAAASALTCALAFWQHWSGFDLIAGLGLRAPVQVPAPESPGHLAGIGTFASRLNFAHAALFPLSMLLGLRLGGFPVGRRRGWLWAALALGVLGLWATFARAAWLALAAIAVAAAAVALWRGWRRAAWGGLAVAGAASALILAVSPGARAWGAAALQPSQNHDRLFLWARAAEVAMDHPLSGVGFGSYHRVLGPYYDRYDAAFPMRTWAHDMPLSLLCETGPFGLFAYCWLIVAGLGLGLTALRRSSGLRAALGVGAALGVLGFAVVGLFHDALYAGAVAYNLAFSLALGAWALARPIELPATLR